MEHAGDGGRGRDRDANLGLGSCHKLDFVGVSQATVLLTNFFTNSKSILEKWGDNEFNEYFGENDLIVVSILISQFINSV